MALLSVPPFESFYEEHRDAVLGELRRLLGRDRAEDAYQETFLKAFARTRPTQRRQPPCLGPDDRPPRCGRPASSARSSAAGARAANRGTPMPSSASSPTSCPRGTRRGRASAELRPFHRRHRCRTRLERGRRTAGGLVRCPQTSKEDAMTVSPLSTVVSAKPRLRQGCSTLRTTSPTLRSGRCCRDDRARPLQDLVRPQPDREADWLAEER